MGVKMWFGRQYAEHTPEYTDLFNVDTSSRGWEEIVELTGFGLVPVKNEGASTDYDAESQGYITRATNVSYGMGFIVSREARDDDQYMEVGKRRSRALAFSARQTKETVAANVYNRAFSASYTGGDGLELLSTLHVTVNGTQSNELATAVDISEDGIEDLCTQIMQAKNSKGLAISLMPQCLLVSPSDYWEAQRIIESPLRSGTANNDKNVLSSIFPKGIKVNHYFSDSDAWFIRTNAPDGMIFFQRTPIEFKPDNDFDTENMKYKCFERYVPTWGDWRSLFGSAGA